MCLPSSVYVHFIGNEYDCERLDRLIGKEFVGVDCEWRAFHGDGTNSIGAVAIIQISSDSDAFVIDLIALAESKVLDAVMCHIF